MFSLPFMILEYALILEFHLRLFQKQYNSPVKKVFLIYKKGKNYCSLHFTKKNPSSDILQRNTFQRLLPKMISQQENDFANHFLETWLFLQISISFQNILNVESKDLCLKNWKFLRQPLENIFFSYSQVSNNARSYISYIFFYYRSMLVLYYCTLLHCVESVHIQRFSGPYFPALGLNTERYGVSLRIQPECEKIQTIILRAETFFTQCLFLLFFCSNLPCLITLACRIINVCCKCSCVFLLYCIIINSTRVCSLYSYFSL